MNCDGFSSRDLLAVANSNENIANSGKRFVILWHSIPSSPSGSAMHGRVSHFDLMFEDSEHLVTFELPKLPIPGERVPIQRLADHRLHYLNYEGPLDPGLDSQDRGHVTRWTEGNYQFYRWTEQKLIVELTSVKLSARIAMLPGDIKKGRIDTQSSFWPAAIDWELRAPRWDLKHPSKRVDAR
jgi:DNA polymerase Ligase (LigD)